MAFKWDEQKLGATESDANRVTFKFQESLPKLPVPDFDAWCQAIIDYTRPLVDVDTHATLKADVAEFRSSGDGDKLVKRLQKWASQDVLDNWLDPFWTAGYLGARCPTLLNVNVGYTFEIPGKYTDWINKTACIVTSLLKFKTDIQNETFPPQTLGKEGKPLCMSQFRGVIGTTRLPQERMDILQSGAPNLSSLDGIRHILVSYQSNLYTLDVIDHDGQTLPLSHIEDSLNSILAWTGKPACPLPGCTGINRDKWAKLRQSLIGVSTRNIGSLHLIDTALFGIVLWDSPAASHHEALNRSLHGYGDSIWLDKSFNLIMCSDQTTMVNQEHSWGDGTTITSMMQYVVDDIKANPPNTQNTRNTILQTHTKAVITPIQFTLTPSVIRSVQDARTEVQGAINNIVSTVINLPLAGSNRVKKIKMSPDGFLQVCLQATQYRAWGRVYSCYEPVMTKLFKLGRTEALRCASEAAINFSHLLTEKQATRTDLELAVEEHVRRAGHCRDGKGVDRMLLGLREMYTRYGKSELGITKPPKLLTNDSITVLTHDTISTTNVTNPCTTGAMFGPVVEDGLGVGYVLRPDQAIVAITSLASNKTRFDSFVKNLALVTSEVYTVANSPSPKL